MSTTILPQARTPWDVIASQISGNISQNLPGAVQKGYQRGVGHQAIEKLQQELAGANGDINKIMPAIAHAYTDNPGLERSGIAEQYLKGARLGNVFGQGTQPTQQVAPSSQSINGQQEQLSQSQEQQATPVHETGIIPRIKTIDEIQNEAKNWAISLNDPSEYDRALNRLSTENSIAQNQLSNLENKALDLGVTPEDMPDFLKIGKKYNNFRDVNQWTQKTKADFDLFKNAKRQLSNAFVPGFFTGLISSPEKRDQALKRLNGPIQQMLKANPEQEPKIRTDLAAQYLSPTEVEEAIHPLSDKTAKAFEALPKGIFPPWKKQTWGDVANTFKGEMKENPFISYDEAVKKDPRAIEVMNRRLGDFFKKNITPETSLSVLRDKLWNDKDYDWRQIGPALQMAQTGPNRIQLTPAQQAEMTEISTQAPRQSISDVFTDWGRWIEFIRGNK